MLNKSRVRVTQSLTHKPVQHLRSRVPTVSPSDVAEEMMSAMVKLAKDPLEPYDHRPAGGGMPLDGVAL